MAELLYRLGKASAKRAWMVIASWLVVLTVGVGTFLAFGGTLSNSFEVPGTASGEVVDRLTEELPDFAGASGTVVFSTEDSSAFTASQRAAISKSLAEAEDLPDVIDVVDPFAVTDELAQSNQDIVDGRVQIDEARAQLIDGEAQIQAAGAELDASQSQIDSGREQIAQAEAAGASAASLESQRAQLDEAQAQLDAGRAQVAEQLQQIADGREELVEQETQLELGAALARFADDVRLVSGDESAAVSNITFGPDRLALPEASKQAVIAHFEANPIDGVEIHPSAEISQGVPEIFGIGEVIGLIVAAIVLFVMLGGVIAASLPLITAIVGVGIGITVSLAFSGLVDMASVTPVLGLMLGLAVGIDYALFIIARHRKQVLNGVAIQESIALANGTAGNAVVFAGATVMIALLALNVTGIPFLGLMGTVGAVCIAVAVLIATSMTPALLGLLGTRVVSSRSRRRMAAVAKGSSLPTPMSTARAVLTTFGAVVGLLIIAVPALSMRLGLPDGGAEAEDSSAYRAYTIIDESFGAGVNGTILATSQLPEGLDDAGVLAAQVEAATVIAANDEVVAVAPIDVSEDNRLAAFQIVPLDGPNSETTAALVAELRDTNVFGEPLGVAGIAASNIDISAALDEVLPIYLVVVVGLSLLIMIVVFRSVLVPLVATGGFVLSLFATYGVIVAVFQWGWGANLLGITPGPILSFLPVILVGILFGLAMDYQLFLASGMREAYVHGSSARLAVSQGFRAGRAVVTAAALIMISVFGGFIFAHDTIIRSIGFGLALGVLLDAFVVRMLLMPAVMHLLGNSAWWLPRWLDRVLPNVDVEGSRLERNHD